MAPEAQRETEDMKTVLAVAVLLFAVAGVNAQATVTVYAYQQSDFDPRGAHSFAVWKKGKESVCISWMIEAERPKFLKLRTDKGRNWTFDDTMKHAKKVGASIHEFGPVKVSDAQFERAKAQAKRLDAGQVRYKAAMLVFPDNVANCEVAIAQVAGRPYMVGLKFGRRGSESLAKFLAESP